VRKEAAGLKAAATQTRPDVKGGRRRRGKEGRNILRPYKEKERRKRGEGGG
jgi:hypothetical protein